MKNNNIKQLGLDRIPKDLLFRCPFCNDKGYDTEGLKYHLTSGSCGVYNGVETFKIESGSGIDEEIQWLVKAMNNAGYETAASCAGHFKMFGNVMLKDGKELMVLPDWDTARRVEALLVGVGICKRLDNKK